MFSPPSGILDCESDGTDDEHRRGDRTGKYLELDVPKVGVVHARKPLPNAIPVLAGTVNSKITAQSRNDYLNLFLTNHLAPGTYETLLMRMMTEDLPGDSIMRVCRAIATSGTARPTWPSSS